MSGAVGSILSNAGALQALNSIAQTSGNNNNLETQLASGLSINSPADNPAGFITAQGFTSQINGITQATSNANQAVSLLQTAQGAVGQQLNIVQNLNSIAVQAANGTQTPAEAQSLQSVVSQLTGQVTSIAQQTQFNNINLLDGTFQGVQFQVGANEGQTLSLSIGSTTSNSIGMQASQVATGTAALYNGADSGVLTTAGSAFTAGSLKIAGSNGTATATVTANESAASIAASINQSTGTTNVAAQASTQMTFKPPAGSYSFTLGNGTSASPTNTISVSATGASGLVSAINNGTAKTGITANLNSAGSLVLTQSQGQNISITGMTKGTLTEATAPAAGNSTAPTGGTIGGTGTGAVTSATIQGQVQLQSDQAFSTSGTAGIGLQTGSTLQTLSSINVSSVSGANKAINIIKYAIQGLNGLGGQLGASQQRLQANINNLSTTNENLNNALAVVQDANIPQVSQKLTQSQIQAQAGVAALKSSSTLQQAYLSLLP